MNFRPNPLLYGAAEDFFSSFKLIITMRSLVDCDVLVRSVEKAMPRYPYFSVSPEIKGNCILLQSNPQPVPVFRDGRCVVLGTEESNGHLLAFGCEGRRIILHASHYIADGMGIFPLLKTVLFLYVSELYGTDGLNPDRIDQPDDPVMEAEYAYPFPEKLPAMDRLPKKQPDNVYSLNADAFDTDGLYAYHLHIPQKNMMIQANPSDGSPVSFLSILLYRALHTLDNTITQPVVAHVQHQYRTALRAPVNRHSLVNYIPVVLPPKINNWNIDRQNTVMRGQIIIGSEKDEELRAVNRLLSVISDEESMSLSEKQSVMRQYVQNSIRGKTFGISYVGKTDWCGLDQYVEDIHAYIGEKASRNMLLIEVMTIGEDFTLNFMQSGCGSQYVDAFIEQLNSYDIPVCIVGTERYTLCDTKIPE